MTTWPDATKTDALDQLRNNVTLADVHRSTGIPKQTLSRWATAHGIDVVRTARENTSRANEARVALWLDRRYEVANKAGALAEEAVDEARSLLRRGLYLEAQRVMTVMGVSIDKAQLLTGGATERVEGIRVERTPGTEDRLAELIDLEAHRNAA